MAVSLSISITQNYQSISNNTSNVTVKVKAKSTYGSYNADAQSGWCKINGTKYTFSHAFSSNTTTTLYSKTLNIAHGSDGKKTLSCSAKYETGVSSGTITASASKTLTTIPRASVPTVSSGTRYLGSATTITTNRKSSSFTHRLTWSWAGKSGTIATDVGASYSWTPNLSTFASYIPNSTSSTCKVTCTTYSGSTSIGSKTVSFTLAMPSYTVPTDGTVSYTDEDPNMILQNLSTISFNPTNASIYSSTITYTVKMDSLSKTVSGTTIASLGTPPTSGDRTLTITAKDGRGKTATATQTITVNPYTLPSITDLKVVRCSDAVGLTEDDEGKYLKIAYAGNVYNDYSNTATLTISVESTNGTYTSSFSPTCETTFSGYVVTEEITECPSMSFTINLIVEDIYTNTSKSINLSTATPIMDFSQSGHEIAFFGISDPEATVDNVVMNNRLTMNNDIFCNNLGINYINGARALIGEKDGSYYDNLYLDAPGYVRIGGGGDTTSKLYLYPTYANFNLEDVRINGTQIPYIISTVTVTVGAHDAGYAGSFSISTTNLRGIIGWDWSGTGASNVNMAALRRESEQSVSVEYRTNNASGSDLRVTVYVLRTGDILG